MDNVKVCAVELPATCGGGVACFAPDSRHGPRGRRRGAGQAVWTASRCAIFTARYTRWPQYADKKAVVLVFLGTECPLATLYAPRLAELAREYAERGVVVLGVDANSHDTPTKLSAFAKTYTLEFPLLLDAGNALADELGATRTPEVFVLDDKRAVRYHGRIDDQFVVGASHDKPRQRDLAAALDELLGRQAGQPRPARAFTGCLISQVSKIEPHGDITYSKHVAAIVNRHCVECHREGELAPFPLSTYDEVVGLGRDDSRSRCARIACRPGSPIRKYGKFSNDCSMSDEEKQNAAAPGSTMAAPRAIRPSCRRRPSFTAGWRMGEPDVVYHMPKPFTVPAEGTVDYQYFTVDPELKEDLWVSVAEARPGNPAVVHHVVLFAVPPALKSSTGSEEAQVARPDDRRLRAGHESLALSARAPR